MPTEPQRPKRIRIRKCGAKLRMPAEKTHLEEKYLREGLGAVFVCGKDAHKPDEPHEDHGIVEMPNGTGREYRMTWTDLGLLTFRRRMKVNGGN